MSGVRKLGTGGRREDLDGRYFRSMWEANWARYLNWLQHIGEIQRWAYEPRTFYFHGIKRGSRSYTPDFQVVNRDSSIEYHEVKGWMDPQSATKLKRMRKYYPQVTVILVDQAAYAAVARQLRRFIPRWESAPEQHHC